MTDLAQFNLSLDDEGFLSDPAAWTPELAKALAEAEGIELTEEHWKVINFCRKDAEETGDSPTLRRITRKAGVSTKELFKLFPKGPAKKVAKIAGLSKPKGCV